MNRINFKEFVAFTDISQENTKVVDVSRIVSDNIYKNVQGIAAHDLAFRIYRSEGEITLSDEELVLLRNAARTLFTPLFIDSLEANLTPTHHEHD